MSKRKGERFGVRLVVLLWHGGRLGDVGLSVDSGPMPIVRGRKSMQNANKQEKLSKYVRRPRILRIIWSSSDTYHIMATDNIEKSFCTTREAATQLGVSVGTVQLWVENGLLQAWKTNGGHRRVMRDSVERLLRRSPDAAQAAPPAPVTTAVSSGPRQLTILVVEDDPYLLRLYKARLSRWPMAPNVICLDNAVEALLTMGRSGVDLLITDLHMPQMDGFGMLHTLRLAPEMAHTTIVVVTGLDAAAIATRGTIPPGIDVLPKPVPFDRLLTIAVSIANSSQFLTLSH